MGKEEIFSKFNIKDYNNELEKVLDKKTFSEDAKNLLISMLYKVEVAYADYNKVKVDTPSKKEIMEELISIIENDCNEIEIIKPTKDDNIQLSNKKFKVDKSKSKISLYPNANMLMFALYKLSKKEFKVKKNYEFIKKPVEDMLNTGLIMHRSEIIRDFDGWNWNIDVSNIKNVTYNLIYQNLIILLSDLFINTEALEAPDTISAIENKLLELYGEELSKKLSNIIYRICLLEYLKQDKSRIDAMFKIKEELVEEFNNMSNKKDYLENLANIKKDINKKIKIIDKIVNNNELLNNEFKKQNNKSTKNKIFSISDLVNIYGNMRNNLIKELEEYTELMKPEVYVAKKTELKEKIRIFGNLKLENYNLEKDLISAIIRLEKYFLSALEIKAKKAKTKKEVIDLICKIRYYKLLPIEKRQIKDVKVLDEFLPQIEKKLITKACNLKAMPIISTDVNENCKIVSRVLESSIIDLDLISIEIKSKNNKFNLTIYDDNTKDSSIEYETLKKLNIKLNKKTKIFI